MDDILNGDHSNESYLAVLSCNVLEVTEGNPELSKNQYFPVVLFIMLYKVLLTFESVDEILKCDHSNEKL